MVGVTRRTGRAKEELPMMGWYGGGLGPLGWVGMGVFWLILLRLIVWLVARLLPGSSGDQPRPTGDSDLEILDDRMASGEIGLAAWQAQRTALTASARGSTSRSKLVESRGTTVTSGAYERKNGKSA
jgi:putative membrane protein